MFRGLLPSSVDSNRLGLKWLFRSSSLSLRKCVSWSPDAGVHLTTMASCLHQSEKWSVVQGCARLRKAEHSAASPRREPHAAECRNVLGASRAALSSRISSKLDESCRHEISMAPVIRSILSISYPFSGIMAYARRKHALARDFTQLPHPPAHPPRSSSSCATSPYSAYP